MPVPPVISTVPSAPNGRVRAPAGAGRSVGPGGQEYGRRATATCGSPVASAPASARGVHSSASTRMQTAGMFGLRTAYQPPHGGRGRSMTSAGPAASAAGDLGRSGDRHGAPGEHDQRGIGRAVAGQPVPHGAQHMPRQLSYGGGHRDRVRVPGRCRVPGDVTGRISTSGTAAPAAVSGSGSASPCPSVPRTAHPRGSARVSLPPTGIQPTPNSACRAGPPASRAARGATGAAAAIRPRRRPPRRCRTR